MRVLMTVGFAVATFGLASGAWARQQPAPTAAPQTGVVGRWRLYASGPGLSNGSLLELKADEKDKSGKKLVGTLHGPQIGDVPLKGEFSKGKIKFSLSIDTANFSLDVEFDGKLLEDGTLAGSAVFGTMGEIDWTAKRVEDGGAYERRAGR